MLHILVIAVPTLLHAFGIFPLVTISIVSAVVLFYGVVRWLVMFCMLFGDIKPVASSLEDIKTQWVVAFSYLAAVVAVYFSGPYWIFLIGGLSIPPAFILSSYCTYITLNTSEGTEEA